MATNGLPAQGSASSQMSLGSSDGDGGSGSPWLGFGGGAGCAATVGRAPGFSPLPRNGGLPPGHNVAQQLEETVMFLVDPTRTVDKAACARAMVFERQIRESPDGLQLALQLLTESSNPNVKFWCLQTVLDSVDAGRTALGG